MMNPTGTTKSHWCHASPHDPETVRFFSIFGWKSSFCIGVLSQVVSMIPTKYQLSPQNHDMAVCQNLVPLVNIKIAGEWMFIPLKMVLMGIDPYPYPHDIPIKSHWFSKPKFSWATQGLRTWASQAPNLTALMTEPPGGWSLGSDIWHPMTHS